MQALLKAKDADIRSVRRHPFYPPSQILPSGSPTLPHLPHPPLQALLKAKDAEIRSVRETLSAGMVPTEEAEGLRAALGEARAAAAAAEVAGREAAQRGAAELEEASAAYENQVWGCEEYLQQCVWGGEGYC